MQDGKKEDEPSAKKSLLNAEHELMEIKNIMFSISEQDIFYSLIAFVSYYTFMIEFYKKNIHKVVSVNELLLFKYIKMIKDIVIEYKNSNYIDDKKSEVLKTIKNVNKRLYTTVKEIKSQANMNLEVELKTISDLIKIDF